MAKKLSEFTERITELLGTDRFLVARGSSGIDYYTTAEDIANFINGNGGNGGGDNPYIEALSGTYSQSELDAIDDFMTAVQERTIAAGDSQWDSLTEIWINAMDNETDAVLGMKGNYTLQLDNAPTFTAREGFKLNGTDQSLFAAINPSEVGSEVAGIGGAYTRLGDASGAVVLYLGGNNTFIEHFGDSSPEDIEFECPFLAFDFVAFVENGIQTIHNGSVTASYYQNSHVFGFNDRSQVTSVSNPISSLPNESNIYWGRFLNLSASNVSSDQYAAEWVGFEDKGWTAAETEAFHADLQTLLTALGAAI